MSVQANAKGQIHNHELQLLASAARTAATTSSDIYNWHHRGVSVVVDITTVTSTPEVTVTIQGKDSLSGKYYTILASAALTSTGTTVLKVYPGITAAANASASTVLPPVWRVSVTVADTDSATYSIGAALHL